ncbi:NAD-dependent epimerase/dehydratase family protein [Promicromonospora sp. MS192]|uniref:NAD-dependent epimerase/dehydratase family protein n=1 Tax=Promicromonospora sp. MS192 TaxID=3412684 RepID=UPI003C2F4E10
MRIFLAGATGVIGSRLLPLLGAAGHEVTGTTRSASRAGAIEGLGGSPVVVDVSERAGIHDLRVRDLGQAVGDTGRLLHTAQS